MELGELPLSHLRELQNSYFHIFSRAFIEKTRTVLVMSWKTGEKMAFKLIKDPSTFCYMPISVISLQSHMPIYMTLEIPQKSLLKFTTQAQNCRRML